MNPFKTVHPFMSTKLWLNKIEEVNNPNQMIYANNEMTQFANIFIPFATDLRYLWKINGGGGERERENEAGLNGYL
jgi:hypothetical protein